MNGVASKVFLSRCDVSKPRNKATPCNVLRSQGTLFIRSEMFLLGWTSDRALHEPEKGLGVGDSTRSIGFDGSRCKLWNGQEASEDSTDKRYGK